jgi:hypothetical protein
VTDDNETDASSHALCEWFAKCIRVAAGVVWHPTLGDVPTCQECADKLDLELEPFTEATT